MAEDDIDNKLLVRRLPVALRAPFTEDVMDHLSSQIDSKTLDGLISEFGLKSSKAQEVKQLPESNEQARELLMYWYKRTTLTSNKVKILAGAASKVGRQDISEYLLDLLPKEQTKGRKESQVESSEQEQEADR